MAVLYICGFSGDLPVIPCSDENIGHFERRNAYPFKFTCNSTGCSGVVVDCGSSHTFRRQSNFFIYGSGVRVVVSDTTNSVGATVISAAKAGIESAKIIAKERIADKNFFMVKPPLILGLKIAVAQFPGPLESPLSSTY